MNAMKALAKDLLTEVESVDDYQAAKTLLIDKIALSQDLQRWAIDYAVETFLSSEWRSGRAARWRADVKAESPPEEPAFGGGARVATRSSPSFEVRRGFAAAVLRAKDVLLMDWEMGPGVRMKDATRPLLQKYAANNEAQSEVMHYRATWYRRVAALLPNDTTPVKAVLREADLEREGRKARE